MSDQHEMLEELGRPDDPTKFFIYYRTKTAEKSGIETMDAMFGKYLELFPIYHQQWDEATQ